MARATSGRCVEGPRGRLQHGSTGTGGRACAHDRAPGGGRSLAPVPPAFDLGPDPRARAASRASVAAVARSRAYHRADDPRHPAHADRSAPSPMPAAAGAEARLTDGRRLLQRLRSRRPRRRARVATRPPSGPPSSDFGSPSSTRTRSAGPASIAAASRRRPSSSRPSSSIATRHLKEFGVVVARRAGHRLRPDGGPPRPVVKRMWTGLKCLVGKNKVDLDRGPRPPRRCRADPGEPARRGRHARRRRRAHPPGDRHHHRHRIAGEEPAGPRRRTASGSSRATTSCAGPTSRRASSSSAPARSASSSPRFYHDIGTDGDRARVPADPRAARGPRRQPAALERSFTRRGIGS